MTLKQIEQLEALMARTSPGPWTQAIVHMIISKEPLGFEDGCNYEFIATSRTAVPELCAALREAVQFLTTITANSQHTTTRIPAEFVDRIRAFLKKWEGK